MSKLLFTLLSILMLIAAAFPALAQKPVEPPIGEPVPPPPPPPTIIDENVVLKTHRVNVTINNQVATTRIEQVFKNNSDRMAEGTYIFPLPRGASVSDLVMYVDGEAIPARILGAEEARATYEEIVRTLRDPALLEYVGQDAIQASVFPIQPRDEIKIEIEYSHVLTLENGLIKYTYPLKTDQFSRLPVENLSVSVQVESNDDIGTIYSPSHAVAINQTDDKSARVGYETGNTVELSDFVLYYSLASDRISANLLTYRESANENGFFLLMLAPPVTVDEDQIVPRDIIVVLDQSGSMFGDKWEQARDAATYVLDNLNPEDRFNVVAFSTGWRLYANDLQSPSEAAGAKQWLSTLEAVGGTEIDGALQQAFDLADPNRQSVVLFLTDGLPTEGETDIDKILDNARLNAPDNLRVFTFGVGDDVDTVLLDNLWRDFRGAGAYVRPNERIDEEVSNLYNKISAPVLTDIAIDFGDIVTDDLYPSEPLPDLFIGSQLIVAGRYRDSGNTSLTLTGKVNGETQIFTYDNLNFPANAGGEATIPRLWATRRIGALLNSIRLNGENPELVDSIVRLSIRYGIITPYTSFFIDETDIFTAQGREEAQETASQNLAPLDDMSSGDFAVGAADSANEMEAAEAAPMAIPTGTPMATSAPAPLPQTGGGGVAAGTANDAEADFDAPVAPTDPNSNRAPIQQTIQVVGDKTFLFQNGIWIDTTYDADTMIPQEVIFLSDAYFDLLDQYRGFSAVFALGDHIIVILDGIAYEILPE